MAKIYVRKIRAGEIAVKDIPKLWRKQVEELLAEQTADEAETG